MSLQRRVSFAVYLWRTPRRSIKGVKLTKIKYIIGMSLNVPILLQYRSLGVESPGLLWFLLYEDIKLSVKSALSSDQVISEYAFSKPDTWWDQGGSWDTAVLNWQDCLTWEGSLSCECWWLLDVGQEWLSQVDYAVIHTHSTSELTCSCAMALYVGRKNIEGAWEKFVNDYSMTLCFMVDERWLSDFLPWWYKLIIPCRAVHHALG